MFYVLSKTVGLLAQPSTWLMPMLLVAALLLRTRFVGAAKRLLSLCLLLVVAGGMLPLSTALILPLEERFARPALDQLAAGAPIAGIVVLGGAEDAYVTGHRGVIALNEAGERMAEAVALARRFPQARIVFTGGATELLYAPAVGADAAELFFREQGLAPERLTLEKASRNTHENAVLSKALAKPRPGERWLLVTSAFHMPRSMGCFRQAGWTIEPWPVDYRTAGLKDLLLVAPNPIDGLKRLDFVLKEWVGLAVYRWTGRTDALFPGPDRRDVGR